MYREVQRQQPLGLPFDAGSDEQNNEQLNWVEKPNSEFVRCDS